MVDRQPSVALVGCGAWGRLILRDLVSLRCDVPVVARSPESRGRARAGGASRVVPTIGELPRVDGVIVATTTTTHVEVLDEVLDLGVPVFVEKPLCSDAAAARRLAAAYPDTLFVMDKWRYHPGVRELARLVRAGELGEPVALVARRVAWGNPHQDIDPLWTYLPHDLAIVLDVLGYLPAPRVAAAEVIGGRLTGATVLLGEQPWVSLEVSTAAPASRRELRVVGETGCAVLDGGYADELLVSRSGPPEGPPERIDIRGEMPLLAELRAFVEFLQGRGPAPMSPAPDGCAVVELIEEVHRMIARTAAALVATG